MIKERLIDLTKKIGLDKSIAYSSGARVVQGVFGLITVLVISMTLSKEEQGYYYTFGSIIAIQVFFELGLTNIIMQFTGHEMAGLSLSEGTTLSGEKANLSRISSLLHFSVKWYGVAALLFVLVTIIAGFIFFSKYPQGDGHEWVFPWILVCIATGISLFISPIMSILMGLGMVKEVSRIRFYQQVAGPILSWILLFSGAKLSVLGYGTLFASLLLVAMMYRDKLLSLLINIWRTKIEERVSYIKEIFPFQWKIAISWISGYFVVQIFNPVLFATEGAVVAGQMGMTLTAFNSISAFSQSWVTTKIPEFSRLIALKNYIKLDSLFNVTLKQMAYVTLFLIVAFIGLLELMKVLDIPLRERFLPMLPIILMAVSIFISGYVNAWSIYLRCHKKEPLLLYSIVTGVLCCISTFVFGSLWGVIGITAGYFGVIAITSIWAYIIFKTKKLSWH